MKKIMKVVHKKPNKMLMKNMIMSCTIKNRTAFMIDNVVTINNTKCVNGRY